MNITEENTWKEMPKGGCIDAGNAEDFRTGDWRSMKPVWLEENASSVCFAGLYALTRYSG